MTFRAATVAILVLLPAAAPALAHHSVSGQFDPASLVTLKGTVSKVDWMNPHIYIHLDVTGPDGTVTTWALSTLPTAMMRRAGLSKDSFIGNSGETLTVEAMPARDGTKHLAWITKVTFADGHYYQLSGQ